MVGHAGLPFIVVTSIAGAFTTYGLSGLRYQGKALVLFAVVVVLTSLVSIQFLTFCVWLTPNQVHSAASPALHWGDCIG